MTTMTKHFVTFYSPGTMVAENNTIEVPSWDVDEAVKIARTIEQRHGAKPYGFRFETMHRGEDDFEPKMTAKSPLYWLGGRIETLEEIEKRNDPKEHILRSNMRINKWDRVIVNDNSYRWTMPYVEGQDILLDVKL